MNDRKQKITRRRNRNTKMVKKYKNIKQKSKRKIVNKYKRSKKHRGG